MNYFLTILLLVIANIFMTIAWYGHLKFGTGKLALPLIILISWGIALIEYCFQTLDCLGIQYGSVHSEIMVDEKGPVLIEVNARPAGSFQKYTFQDKVMKNHETAVSLDSYFMDQKQFFDRYPECMHLRQPAAVKQICLDETIFVNRVKITERLSRLRSFEYAIENGENCVYPKTTNLDTNGGMIYLTSPDPDTLKKDLDEILLLEREGLSELYDWHKI